MSIRNIDGTNALFTDLSNKSCDLSYLHTSPIFAPDAKQFDLPSTCTNELEDYLKNSKNLKTKLREYIQVIK